MWLMYLSHLSRYVFIAKDENHPFPYTNWLVWVRGIKHYGKCPSSKIYEASSHPVNAAWRHSKRNEPDDHASVTSLTKVPRRKRANFIKKMLQWPLLYQAHTNCVISFNSLLLSYKLLTLKKEISGKTGRTDRCNHHYIGSHYAQMLTK